MFDMSPFSCRLGYATRTAAVLPRRVLHQKPFWLPSRVWHRHLPPKFHQVIGIRDPTWYVETIWILEGLGLKNLAPINMGIWTFDKRTWRNKTRNYEESQPSKLSQRKSTWNTVTHTRSTSQPLLEETHSHVLGQSHVPRLFCYAGQECSWRKVALSNLSGLIDITRWWF